MIENKGANLQGSLQGRREGSTHTPGNLYRCQKKRVTKFDGWKLLKRKEGQRARQKMEKEKRKLGMAPTGRLNGEESGTEGVQISLARVWSRIHNPC